MWNSCHPARMATNTFTKKNPEAVALGRLGGLKGGPALVEKSDYSTQSAHKSSACCRTVWVAFSCLSGG